MSLLDWSYVSIKLVPSPYISRCVSLRLVICVIQFSFTTKECCKSQSCYDNFIRRQNVAVLQIGFSLLRTNNKTFTLSDNKNLSQVFFLYFFIISRQTGLVHSGKARHFIKIHSISYICNKICHRFFKLWSLRPTTDRSWSIHLSFYLDILC